MRRPLANVAVIETPVPEGWGAGALAGQFEAADVRPVFVASAGGSRARDQGRERVEKPASSSQFTSALQPLLAWRRLSALRRSLDHGSRWVVFEPHHPLVWRRLERQVRAFLYSLALDGLVPAWGGSRLDVRCEPVGEGAVALKVRVPTAGIGEGMPGERLTAK